MILDRLTHDAALSRRTFLTVGAALGGGLLIGVGSVAVPDMASAAGAEGGQSFVPNAFVRAGGAVRFGGA